MAVYKIGEVGPFKTKSEAIEIVKSILSTATIDEPLTGIFLECIDALFCQHPDYYEKTVKGISGYMIRCFGAEMGLKQHRGFVVLHPDGTATDFSYRKCFGLNLRPTFESAARNAIRASQHRFKENYYGANGLMPCQSCSFEFHREQVQVHHVSPTFAELIQRWRKYCGEPVVIRHPTEVGSEFADPEVKQAFIEWHNGEAWQAVICKKCHVIAEQKVQGII